MVARFRTSQQAFELPTEPNIVCLLLCETFANGDQKYVAALFNFPEKEEAHFMSEGINFMANLT